MFGYSQSALSKDQKLSLPATGWAWIGAAFAGWLPLVALYWMLYG